MNEVPANVLAEYEGMTTHNKAVIFNLIYEGYSPQVITYAAHRMFRLFQEEKKGADSEL